MHLIHGTIIASGSIYLIQQTCTNIIRNLNASRAITGDQNYGCSLRHDRTVVMYGAAALVETKKKDRLASFQGSLGTSSNSAVVLFPVSLVKMGCICIRWGEDVRVLEKALNRCQYT